MSLEFRSIVPDEIPSFIRLDGAAFGEFIDERELETIRPLIVPEDSLAVFDGDQMVATASMTPFDLTLPGGVAIPAAGITFVAVRTSHRRLGILRGLMRRQIDTLRARGEMLAILTASESGIYGRFGYGMAVSRTGFSIERRHAGFLREPRPEGRITLLEREAAREALPSIYDRARLLQPGALTRDALYWNYHLGTPKTSVQFVAIHESLSGEAEGYVSYRIERQHDGDIRINVLHLAELIAANDAARAALWHYCLNIDLVESIWSANSPTDEPLRWLLAEPRRLRFDRLADFLWLRLLDVPAALAARRYPVEDRLVLGVSDPFLPDNEGAYYLEGGPAGAICRRTDAAPDLLLSIEDLGAAYLGGVRFSTLARAGRVVEVTPGALRRGNALFTSEPAPWCSTHF